jgi:hypothetical protein
MWDYKRNKKHFRARCAARAAALGALLALPAGAASFCATTKVVKSGGGGDCATIQACINLIPSTLTGNYCVDIQDNGPYAEAPSVTGINSAGFQILIGSTTGTFKPLIKPPAGGSGFTVSNSSVIVSGIRLIPTGAVSYGVFASSSYVQLSSVVVDSGGNITKAGIAVSSFSTVSYASVTVQNADGLLVVGNGTAVSYSSVAANSATLQALELNGAVGASVASSYFRNAGGTAGTLTAYTTGATISLSTFSSAGGSTTKALAFNGASSNTVSRCMVASAVGYGAYVSAGASGNTLTLSTFTTVSPTRAALFLTGASTNVISASYVQNTSGYGLYLQASSNFNSVFSSTFVSRSASAAAGLNASSSNTISGSLLRNTVGYALRLDAGSSGNFVTLSSMTSAWSGGYALYLNASTSNVFTSDYIADPAGSGVYLDAGADGTSLAMSTVASNIAGQSALYMNGANGVAVTQCVIVNPTGTGATLNTVVGSTISQSSIFGDGGAEYGLALLNSQGNAVSATFIANPDGDVGYLDALSSGNLLVSDNLTSNSGGSSLHLDGASLNVVQGCFAVNPAGDALLFGPGASSNTVTQSTMTSAASAFAAVEMNGAFDNVLLQDYLYNLGDRALYVHGVSYANAIFASVIISSAPTAAVEINAAVGTSLSSCSLTSPLGYGLLVQGGAQNTAIADSDVSGATAAYVSGSTNTTFGASRLIATDPAGTGLRFDAGGMNLSVASCAVSGGAQGTGIAFDAGGFGALTLTTNTVSGGLGVLTVALQDPTAQLYVSSNTFYPAASTAADSFGVSVVGPLALETFENNGFLYRSRASSGANTAYAFYATGGTNLIFDRNRISNPGMVTGGAFQALTLSAETNAAVTYNDIYSTAPALSGHVLAAFTTGSVGVSLRNNILFSSSPVSAALVLVDVASAGGLSADYNDYFDPKTLSLEYAGVTQTGLGQWRSASGLDAHAISTDPLWHAPVSGDFHPASYMGRFDARTGSFAHDLILSPSVDAADPADPFDLEPQPNSGRANLGSYGNTPEASKSYIDVPGCVLQRNVSSINGPYYTIQSAVDSLPGTLTGPACVVLRDGSTYNEQVTVQGFTNAGSSITIEADPLSTLSPIIVPPVGSTAAFFIANSSVNVFSFTIAPTAAVMYGVWASSTNVSLSSVVVRDPGGRIRVAGVSLSSAGAIVLSSVTTAASPALMISGAAGASVSDCVLSGSSGAVVGGSSGVVFERSSFAGAAAGAGLWLRGGNDGLVRVSTNTFWPGARYGLFVGTQTAGTQLWVASNTFLPSISGANDTYGILLDGLTTGATIQNNDVFFRFAGASGGTAYGFLAKSASGINFDRNRITDNGALTGGSFVGVGFVGTTLSRAFHVDLLATGSGLTSSYLMRLWNGASGVRVTGSVLVSSVVASGTSVALAVDAASQAGVASDYNDFFSSNTLAFQWGATNLSGLSAWTGASSQDAHSISADPLWPSVAAQSEDFHPRSIGGRFDAAVQAFTAFGADAALSPTNDAGDPFEDYSFEPAPNASRVNQGSYGGTAQASISVNYPVGATLAGVWLSSAAVRFLGVGADSYVVEASTDSGFAVTSSSAGVRPGILSPQGLFANTTYYLRAGAVFGAATNYAPSVATATTLSPRLSGTRVLVMATTSASIAWNSLPSAAVQGSSNSSEGYILQASTVPDFSGTLVSSQTPSVAQSTLTLMGLSFGATYYFRAGSLNWSGVANFSAAVSSFASVADTWAPGAVADLAATATAPEGQLRLDWTAPDANANVFVSSTAVSGYFIRVATFSVASIGGSTTAWWSAATDVRLLAAPALRAAPPAPAFPGTAQSLTLNQLFPGVGYYAAIVSSDAAGNLSPIDVNAFAGPQAGAATAHPAPPPPATMTAVGTSTSSFLVSWSPVTLYALWGYRIYIDSTPPNDFSHAFTVNASSAAQSLSVTGLSTGTYAVQVVAYDFGAPTYPGSSLESAPTAAATVTLTPVVRPPGAPVAVWLDAGQSSTTVHWMGVARYADGGAFALSTTASPSELTSYLVDRATAPCGAVWSTLAAVSTTTPAYFDAGGGYGWSYRVRAVNTTGTSPASVVRSGATDSVFIVAPDGLTSLEVPLPAAGPLIGDQATPSSVYVVAASSHPEDLAVSVVKSVEFTASKGDGAPAPHFELSSHGFVRLRYETSPSSVVPSGLLSAATPSNLGAYWFNGRAYIPLYGKLDALAQTITVETSYLGRYQLRVVERATSFVFDKAGVSNREITPNGDGKNDTAVFTYDNPRGSDVVVRILDLQGKVVVGNLPVGPIADSKVWDATARGRKVPSGVYVYQVQAEGRTYSGTVAVIR